MTNYPLKACAAAAMLLMLTTTGCTGSENSVDYQTDLTKYDNSAAMNTGGTPKTGGTLKVAGSSDVDSLDSTSANNIPSKQVLRMITRQLFTYKGSTSLADASKPVPDLAAEVPTAANGGISADGKIYTIKVQTGAKWDTSPARAITTTDIVRGFKRMCNPVKPTPSMNYYNLTIVGMQEYCGQFRKVSPKVDDIKRFIESSNISGITATDNSVQFRLLKPASDFLDILAIGFGSPIPLEYLDYLPASPDLIDNLISSGPYKLASYTPGVSIKLVQNPSWAEASDPVRQQYLDGVDIAQGVSSTSVSQQLQTGSQDIQWDEPLPGQELEKLARAKDKRLGIFPSYNARPYVSFNLFSPNNNKAMTNIKVRQAIAFAIDKVAVQQAFGGPRAARIETQFIPLGTSGHDSEKQTFDPFPTEGSRGDVEKCKALLKEAGLNPGELVLNDIERADDQFAAAAQTVQQDLKECGITTRISTVPVADYYSNYLRVASVAKSGAWDISLTAWNPYWTGNNGRTFIQPLFDGRAYTPGSYNFSDFDDSEVNSHIERALTASDPAAASDAWHAADRAIVEKNVWVVPLLSQYRALFRSDRVHNALFLPNTFFYDWSQIWLG